LERTKSNRIGRGPLGPRRKICYPD